MSSCQDVTIVRKKCDECVCCTTCAGTGKVPKKYTDPADNSEVYVLVQCPVCKGIKNENSCV